MSYLLDTNICSAHIRRLGGLAHRFIQHSGRLWMPTIVLTELYAGAYMLDVPDWILMGIAELRKDVGLLDFDETCAEEFGKLRGWLKHHGIQRNAVDLIIAAVALAHDLTLVTHNTHHFQNRGCWPGSWSPPQPRLP
jgi:tRNA(fMet)-specific endonuclease VapC